MVKNSKVLARKTLHDGYLTLDEIQVEYDGTDGDPVQATREVVVRGDAAVVLMYEQDTDSVIFVKQFRVPAVEHDEDWLVEIPAGVVDEGEDAETAAVREVMEETGYRVNSIEPVKTFYVSPGYTTERMHLFYAEVNTVDKISDQHGLIEEGEDIKLVKVPVDSLRAIDFYDAKTILAVQWFMLTRVF